jgi:Ca2+-binding EF-hand superfamily protein
MVFHMFDDGQTGKISRENLSMCNSYAFGDFISKEEIAEMVNESDMNQTGWID